MPEIAGAGIRLDVDSATRRAPFPGGIFTLLFKLDGRYPNPLLEPLGGRGIIAEGQLGYDSSGKWFAPRITPGSRSSVRERTGAREGNMWTRFLLAVLLASVALPASAQEREWIFDT